MALAGAALTGACGGGADDPHAALPRGRHNVLVFLVDTLRADRLGPYGHPGGLTPRLDAFADEALVFDRCIAQSTWTKPTTASLLTGLYPYAHGANYSRSVLPESVETLAELLAGEGYATAAFGSNPHIFAESMGFEQGFGAFEPIEPARDAPFPRGERIVDAALAWLDGGAPDDAPFFLYLHLIDPHFPYDPPGHEGPVYTVIEEAEALPPAERGRLGELYDGEVAYVDTQFGRLLDALDERGLADDTLLVFVSDHGEELFEHGDLAHHSAKMFEEVARVPLLVRSPGLPEAARGRRITGVVEQVDLKATVVDALGLPAARAGAGTSLFARALRAAPPERQHALVETEDGSVGRGIVAPEWKYVRRWTPTVSEELYHLGEDPAELTDRAADEPEVVRAMRALLAAEMRHVPPTYALRVENGTDELVKVFGFIATDDVAAEMVRLVDVERLDSERADGDGPFATEQRMLDGRDVLASTFTLRVAPGDSDGFLFRPHPADPACRVGLIAGGIPVAAEHIALGPGAERPPAVPFELDPAHADRWSASGEFAPAEGLLVRVWRVLETVGEEADLSAEDEAVLRAVGYLGGED
ncbi:MAG: sulfatase [Planctomycetota bacterium]